MSWGKRSPTVQVFFNPENCSVAYHIIEKINPLQLTMHLENGLPDFRYNPRLIYFLNSP
jgi:hypothetical protein